jgi:hypothetical protein
MVRINIYASKCEKTFPLTMSKLSNVFASLIESKLTISNQISFTYDKTFHMKKIWVWKNIYIFISLSNLWICICCYFPIFLVTNHILFVRTLYSNKCANYQFRLLQICRSLCKLWLWLLCRIWHGSYTILLLQVHRSSKINSVAALSVCVCWTVICSSCLTVPVMCVENIWT